MQKAYLLTIPISSYNIVLLCFTFFYFVLLCFTWFYFDLFHFIPFYTMFGLFRVASIGLYALGPPLCAMIRSCSSSSCCPDPQVHPVSTGAASSSLEAADFARIHWPSCFTAHHVLLPRLVFIRFAPLI